MHRYECMLVCKYVSIYVCKCMCMYVIMYACKGICMYVYAYVCVCMYECIYVFVCVCRYVSMYACKNMCIYIYICIYIYVCMGVCIIHCIYCVRTHAPSHTHTHTHTNILITVFWRDMFIYICTNAQYSIHSNMYCLFSDVDLTGNRKGTTYSCLYFRVPWLYNLCSSIGCSFLGSDKEPIS